MAATPTLARCALFLVATAATVRTGDVLRQHILHGQPESPADYKPADQQNFDTGPGPSYYYHYQQHRGQPLQQIHVQYPGPGQLNPNQQTRFRNRLRVQDPQQTFGRWVAVPARSRNAVSSPSRNQAYAHTHGQAQAASTPTPSPPSSSSPPTYVEYPAEDSGERMNNSNKVYFEDHNGNDTYREHHYRHVTVKHFYYNASRNASDHRHAATPQYHSSYVTPDPLNGKDVKHHYYYNEYKHDHRNKTADNVDPQVKHHYYYNEYKHDHRNKTDGGDPNVKYHYHYNEYKHDHRNKTADGEDPQGKHHYYYNEYKHDHRNKTSGEADSRVKHHNYHNDYKDDHRNTTSDNYDPPAKHYYKEYKQPSEGGDQKVKYHHPRNEYKHEQRSQSPRSEVPTAKQHYNYNDYRNNNSNTKNYYYKDYTDVKSLPKCHSQYSEEGDSRSVGEEDPSSKSGSSEDDNAGPPITDVDAKEDYEYVNPEKDQIVVTTTETPVVKHHHHYYKEYHYNNGRLVANGSNPAPIRNRPQNPGGQSHHPPNPSVPPPYSPTGYVANPQTVYPLQYQQSEPMNPSRYIGLPFVVKDNIPYDQGPEPKHPLLGNLGHPFFSWVKPNDGSFRGKRPPSNGSLGYLLVDPLGRLPPLRIHASVAVPPIVDRKVRKVRGYGIENPLHETGSYRQVPRPQPHRIKLRQLRQTSRPPFTRFESGWLSGENFSDRSLQLEAS